MKYEPTVVDHDNHFALNPSPIIWYTHSRIVTLGRWSLQRLFLPHGAEGRSSVWVLAQRRIGDFINF